MVRAKPNKKAKPQKHTLTDKQFKQYMKEAADAASRKMLVLCLVAAQDEFDADEDQLCSMAVRLERYSQHVERDLVKFRDVQNALRNHSGLQLNYDMW